MLVAIVTFLLIMGPVYLFYGIVAIFTLPFLAVKKVLESRKKKGPVYHIVTVKFRANGRAFDYICDDMTVKALDVVIVNGYNGATPAKVVDVSDKYESELVLPIEKYKKILRKVESGRDLLNLNTYLQTMI